MLLKSCRDEKGRVQKRKKKAIIEEKTTTKKEVGNWKTVELSVMVAWCHDESAIREPGG